MTKFCKNSFSDCSLCTNVKESIFHLQSFKKGDVYHRQVLDKPLLVFLLKGELMVNYGVTKSACLKSGQMILLPKQFQVVYKAPKDGQVLVCTLGADLHVCNQHSIQLLQKYFEQTTDQILLNHDQKFLCSLKYNEVINLTLKQLVSCLSEGITCLHYQEIKREEIFLLFRAFLTPKEVAMFFYPVLSQEPDFKDFVYANYQEINDVKSFAERANMSVRTFNRRFKDAFDDTAQHWLMARKSESVLYDICQTTLSFSEISHKHDFSSPSYFSSFCKSQFGRTPATLRKQWQNGEDLPFIG